MASLLRETDPDVLLAAQAANQAAVLLTDELMQRQAQHIIYELSKAMKG